MPRFTKDGSKMWANGKWVPVTTPEAPPAPDETTTPDVVVLDEAPVSCNAEEFRELAAQVHVRQIVAPDLPSILQIAQNRDFPRLELLSGVVIAAGKGNWLGWLASADQGAINLTAEALSE